MANNNNDIKDTNTTEGGFGKAIEFCKKNVRYIAVAGLFVVLVIVLTKGIGGRNAATTTEQPPAADGTEMVVQDTESVVEEAFMQDAYPEVNELITKYYKAYAKGNTKKLSKLAKPLTDMEKSYISVFSQYVEGYQNISCYTKSGMEQGSYIVSVYLETKFKDVETVAPGLETFYVRTDLETGKLYIDSLYGQFNAKMKENDVDEEVAEFLSAFNKQSDVVALETEVWQKYESALAVDENLKKMVDTTVPDAMTVWAHDQVAAAKKAEEEKVAAEEAAKKAQEEEAAKKAEEEKRQAELAAAVTVYAIDNVNVRSQPSEEAEVLGKLEIGMQTTRLEEKDGWSRVDYTNGTQGYVKSEYLSTEQPAAPAETPAEDTPSENAGGRKYYTEGEVITLSDTVNVRKSMSEDSEKVATAFAGEQVTVILSYAEGWTKVTYGDKTGFIKTEVLR